MSRIEIKHITHRYQENDAVLKDVSYAIRSGEFFSLLGPSGCGKSTLLNIIGGFLNPTEGSVEVDGREILHLPSYQRNIGMVFQSYALFPHMTVFKNIAYGLSIKKAGKDEIRRRVAECLDLVQLSGLGDRMPHQLSGGQQQRVAIARALANSPSILMLDEPMGNLDAKLRKEMQVELRAIQQRTGITTIMVTHDQEEAMSMSDRIGIMQNGTVQQVGTPYEIYRTPANSFVAGFLGNVNMTHAVLADPATHTYLSSDWTDFDGQPVSIRVAPENCPLSTVGNALFMIRPERIEISLEPRPDAVAVAAESIVYVGSALQITASFGKKGRLFLDVSDPFFAVPPKVGDRFYIAWKPGDFRAIAEQEAGA
ncbi:putative spermidine/putrescine transport system ATP-binding protein [Sporobacter termitidis DSM 10068]|uniref:ABC-type quaternary amine transporter n=1 Tax=Sporobacter termitidis DSM 10068 TaxID=1123282 RepID=A0A1M5XD09_9FIRM|nr:ABC transporter ATP-binding protein [Sporobacter termitidis]SHH97083.1 putative spermidine/putrescine transport system ATP-binding protein [Sporobacter termitidis DSM 10068]